MLASARQCQDPAAAFLIRPNAWQICLLMQLPCQALLILQPFDLSCQLINAPCALFGFSPAHQLNAETDESRQVLAT